MGAAVQPEESLLPTLARRRRIRGVRRRPAVVGLLLSLPLLAAPPATTQETIQQTTPGEETPWTVLDQHPGRGEQCLVCGQRIFGLDVLELRYKGRTFHVAEPMMADFQAEPERYFRKLQPRAALFDEEQVRQRPLASGWLVLGLYVLAGLLVGALTAYLAVGRARRPLAWFFGGLAGNVVALAALLALPRGDASALPAGVPPGLAKVPTTRSPVTCPACGGSNHPAAARCSTCGAALTPTAEAETARI